MPHLENPTIVATTDNTATQLVALWSNWNVKSADQIGNNMADCIINLEVTTESTMEDMQSIVERLGKKDYIIVIMYTDASVNIFEWFDIKQVYSYTLNGYFHVITVNNVGA